MKRRDTKKIKIWLVWFGQDELTGNETEPIKFARNAERKARNLKSRGFYVEMVRLVFSGGLVIERDVFVI
jgi:hypothetical protein